MTRRLILIHGRAQQRKDSIALKAEWLQALEMGMANADLKMPIPETDVRFPYYGDTLAQLDAGRRPDEVADIVVRGSGTDDDEQRFMRRILEETRKRAGITEAQLAALAGTQVIERGLENQAWFQSILQALDRHVPYASGASIALATHDVYQYLKNDSVREVIDEGVAQAFEPGVETVVVAHSLGTVVAYRLLRLLGKKRGWKVPVFITVGCPLAVAEIQATLRREASVRCPECVGSWFNAFDDADVVALYPLIADQFALDPDKPAIENKSDVHNHTENRHGIGGYLDDTVVAARIHAALL